MRRRKIARAMCLAGVLSGLLAGFAMSATASAAQWYFDGKALEGTETMTNGTPPSLFTVPGITFGCQPLPLEATIKKSAGVGSAEIVDLPFGVCFTDSPLCTIEAFTAEALPWKTSLSTVLEKNYLVIKGVKVSFLFGGEECALYETVVQITGTAGGLVDNEGEAIVFNPTTFKATGTELKAFGEKVEWNAVLELRATGPHSGQELSLK